ncbi:MAG: sensor histidine kinase [Planctomycetota bacterium]|nr:MAG: sensor histidine kinase [Planctomycetota bacterium]
MESLRAPSPQRNPAPAEAADLAHDVRNLLAVVLGHAELQLERLRTGEAPGGADADLRRSLEAIRLAAGEATALCARTLAPPGARAETVPDLGLLARRVAGLLAAEPGADPGCVLEGPDGLAVAGSAADLERVLLNLLWNSRAANQRTGAGGAGLDLVLRWGEGPAGPFLEVADRGPGPSPEWVDRLAREPVGGEGERCGSGHGLAAVAAAVRRLGGRLRVAPRSGGGSRIRIELRPPS